MADGRQFEHHAEEDAEAEFEQVSCPMFEGMTQAQRELDVDDKFEEQEVGGVHGWIYNFK